MMECSEATCRAEAAHTDSFFFECLRRLGLALSSTGRAAAR